MLLEELDPPRKVSLGDMELPVETLEEFRFARHERFKLEAGNLRPRRGGIRLKTPDVSIESMRAAKDGLLLSSRILLAIMAEQMNSRNSDPGAP